MKRIITIGFVLSLLLALSLILVAQSKKPKNQNETSTSKAKPSPTPESTPEADNDSPLKRNERPGVENGLVPKTDRNPVASAYFYEFSRPGFVYEKVIIEHNGAGKGTISFLKNGYEEMITDPVNLSSVTMSKINTAVKDLNFLDSTEDYQFERDFSHMGNVVFRLKSEIRERTAKFNWTENKYAKILMDEYRRIGNEYTWRFEILIARENQQLQTPGLMDSIDSLIRRGEISDPAHLVPFLTELSFDERLPLMARNRAAKLIKQIEKAK